MKEISYWATFRLIFVIFSLYLMGDAFYRWDGFKYYASLSEFLLSVSLASVLLTIITLVASFLIWLPCAFLEWFSDRTGWHKQKELLYLFVPVFLLAVVATWSGKRMLLPLMSTSFPIKIIALFCALGISIFFIWLLRDKSGQCIDRIAQWMAVIQSRITPLVWLFGIFVLISVPVVTYQTWFTGTETRVFNEIDQSLVKDKNRPNIILVTFDAMSAENMSLYGYNRPTTPFINEWADTATVFTRAEAESNYTAPTTSSLITGKRVWSHLRFSRMHGSPPIKTDTESLPVVLKKNGYYNMAFMVNTISTVNNLGVAASFDLAPFSTEFMVARNSVRKIHKTMSPLFADKFKIDNWFLQNGFVTATIIDRLSKDFDETSYPPEKAFENLITAIDRSEKPFFAWIHLNPPHGPYLPPAPYKGMFDKSEKMRTIKRQLKERNELLEFTSLHKRFPSEIETLRARYDEFIRYCDSQFEGFIEQLNKKGRSDNTIIILSTDHGEIFDHNNILHGNTLYEPETHIPLIIKEPGQSKGRVVDDLVEQVDIPATILDLSHISFPSWMEGRSLVPLMRGDTVEPISAFSMNLEENSSRNQQITKGTIAVWQGDYKLINYLEKEQSQLFNLRDDPGELTNLIDAEPEVGLRLLDLIDVNLKRANERIVK